MPESDLPRFDLLELEETSSDGEFCVHAKPELCTPFGFLYGGTGIASSIEAAERTTGRPLQWITTQFIGSPSPGDTVEISVSVVAEGRSTSQVQVDATVDGRPLFSSLAAHNTRPVDCDSFSEMPLVPSPLDCEPFLPAVELIGTTFFDTLDRRVAAGIESGDRLRDGDSEVLAIWVRLLAGPTGSPATQAWVADIGSMPVSARRGAEFGSTSLDNTLGVVDTVPSEWVLLDMRADGYHRSVGHSTTLIWSEDGRLLGVASQSAIMRTSHMTGNQPGPR